MSSLLYNSDQGDAIIVAGLVYQKIGAVLGIPDGDIPDQNNITSFVYNYADAQGKTVYSAGERAVSRYISSNYNSVSMPANDTWYNVFTAPADGICRLWISDRPVSVQINGGGFDTFDFGSGGEVEAYPVNVSQGDIIDLQYNTLSGRTGYCTFLPFIYP